MVDWQQHSQFVNKDNACLSKVRDSQMLYQHVYKCLAGRVLRLEISMVEHGVEPGHQLRETMSRFDERVSGLGEQFNLLKVQSADLQILL